MRIRQGFYYPFNPQAVARARRERISKWTDVVSGSGTWNWFTRFSLVGWRIKSGKGIISTMRVNPRTTQKMARKAFGLLLELREHDNAYHLLTQANAFLEMLAKGNEIKAAPIMLSVRVMQVGKP